MELLLELLATILLLNKAALNESNALAGFRRAGAASLGPINLDQLRTVPDKFISGNEDTLQRFPDAEAPPVAPGRILLVW